MFALIFSLKHITQRRYMEHIKWGQCYTFHSSSFDQRPKSSPLHKLRVELLMYIRFAQCGIQTAILGLYAIEPI